MEQIFLWKIPLDHPEELMGKYLRSDSPDRFLFLQGKALSESIGTPVVEFSASARELSRLDDLSNSSRIPLVSPRVAELIQGKCPGDVQFVDTRVVAADRELEGYTILNLVHTVRSIDHGRSEVTLIPGTDSVMSIRKLTCLPDCLRPFALARDEEYRSNVLVREDVRDALVGIGVEGVGLYLPSEVPW